MAADIEEKIAIHELELARLVATPVYPNVQRLRGAIAALRELKGEETLKSEQKDDETKAKEDCDSDSRQY